jgi:hypothetical protein
MIALLVSLGYGVAFEKVTEEETNWGEAIFFIIMACFWLITLPLFLVGGALVFVMSKLRGQL